MNSDEPTVRPTAPAAGDLPRLERAVDLAAEALRAGDEPFGSVLVGADGTVLAEERNRVHTLGDPTWHPEFELVRWATAHLSRNERAKATVFTSGEHCPMCAAAHGWAGLGAVVYAHSAAQLARWLDELDVPSSPVRCMAIGDVVPGLEVRGPAPELTDRMRALHHSFHRGPRDAEQRSG
ncbi:nucleoside deaminase [Streptomyces sp. NTK 937]|uniref:nucleoside deaminase n=1 Tax=Streptomyces sp. NTK 937 TaxID=1487711 RepID=UPI0004A8B816|nr:nucleoside deaminase [Streptomyces sp. NTK 937]KDQ66807.1 cytidine deaminase [Streptomyces sp. NTK 937]